MLLIINHSSWVQITSIGSEHASSHNTQRCSFAFIIISFRWIWAIIGQRIDWKHSTGEPTIHAFFTCEQKMSRRETGDCCRFMARSQETSLQHERKLSHDTGGLQWNFVLFNLYNFHAIWRMSWKDLALLSYLAVNHFKGNNGRKSLGLAGFYGRKNQDSSNLRSI